MNRKLQQICAGIAETQTMIEQAKLTGRSVSNLEQVLSELIIIKTQLIENSKEALIHELRFTLS